MEEEEERYRVEEAQKCKAIEAEKKQVAEKQVAELC